MDQDLKTRNWREEAKEIQQRFYETLGDRTFDLFERDQRWALETKIGFALFGEPTEGSQNSKNGYSKRENEEINRLCHLIYHLQNWYPKVTIAFLFVIGKVEKELFCLPVFKILNPGEGIYFLDQLGRVYQSWMDFKDNNKFPDAIICYPEDGIYQADRNGSVLVTFDKSPSLRIESKALSVLDAASIVVTIGSTVVGIASMFVPVIGPIALAATVGATSSGIYGVARGSQQIHDRSIHKQSISLIDSTARNCWLSIFGSVFGIGSGLAVKGMVRMAASGRALGKLGMIAVNVLNYGSLTINGLGVASGLANLIEKKEKGELREVDILKFTTSVLFFTNAAMNTKTANNIIVEMKTDMFTTFRSNLSRGIKNTFGKVFQSPGVNGKMQDFGQIIKGIKNVSSKDEFFGMLIGNQNQSSLTKLDDNGVLERLSKIFPLQTSLSSSGSTNIGTSATSGLLNPVDISKLYLSVQTTALAIVVVEKAFTELGKKYIKVADGVELRVTDRIMRFFSELLTRYFPNTEGGSMTSGNISRVIIQSERFAQESGCTTEEDYFDFTRFLVIYRNSLLNDMEKEYQDSQYSKMVVNIRNPSFRGNLKDPNERKKYFLDRLFKSPINESELKKIFKQYSSEVTALNNDGGLKFCTNYAALNEYYHSYVIDGYERTPREFFEVARKVANDENCQVQAEKDTDTTGICITFSDKNIPVVVTVVKCKKEIFLKTVSFKEL